MPYFNLLPKTFFIFNKLNARQREKQNQ